ncbi:MAG: SsrA-binding protein SmpB [Candidatus Muirbacterium halophilum]|nr:SsrA-binding protein SmpB [Candidatus Muirbacterium halophilum]
MKLITKNRKAYFEYEIIEIFEVGIILLGSEVKSIRNNNININDCYAYVSNNEIFVKNMKISRYKQMHSLLIHDENREKKLLLHKKEINKITKALQDKGTTLIVLEVYINQNKIKIKLAIAKGKKLWNKKESIKARDIDRQTKQELN